MLTFSVDAGKQLLTGLDFHQFALNNGRLIKTAQFISMASEFLLHIICMYVRTCMFRVDGRLHALATCNFSDVLSNLDIGVGRKVTWCPMAA